MLPIGSDSIPPLKTIPHARMKHVQYAGIALQLCLDWSLRTEITVRKLSLGVQN